jgi:hypothetical protein
MPSVLRVLPLLLMLLAIAALLPGCVSAERQGDLQWQKYNPNYRPLYPDEGRQWGW